jgi:hypothetical protein
MSLRSEWAKAVTKYGRKIKKPIPAIFGNTCALVDAAYKNFMLAKVGTDSRRKALKQLQKAVAQLRGPAYSALVKVTGQGMVFSDRGDVETGIPEVNLHMKACRIIDSAKIALAGAEMQWNSEPKKTTGKEKKEVLKELTL